MKEKSIWFYIEALGAMVAALWMRVPLAGQAPRAPDPHIEAAADVTKVGTGPATGQLNYASDGTTITSAMPKSIPGYTLNRAGGGAYTSGVTWAVSVVAGSFVGTAPSVTVSAGAATLVLNSGITGADVTVAVTPTYGGKAYPPVLTKITKNVAAPDSGGSGDGGTTVLRSAISTLSSTSFIQVANDMSINVGSDGSASLTCSADIASNEASSRTVELKAQRESSPGTWVDVGSTTSATAPGTNAGDIGFISHSANATGLTASSTQKFRYMARLTLASANGVEFNGTASAQG